MTTIIMLDENGQIVRRFFRNAPRYVDWPGWRDGNYAFVEGSWDRCVFRREKD